MKQSTPLRRTPMKRRAEGPTAPREVKPRSCTQCPKVFIPARPMQDVCGLRCAQRAAKAKRLKEAASHRAALMEVRETIPRLIAAAQKEFNKWIRTRDHDKPCISCAAPPPDLSKLHAGRDAGHYRSTGSASHLRFNEDNCHAQCVHCNQFGAGRAVDYRIGLVGRIGLAAVEALEADNTPHKWTKEELRGIRAAYKSKLKQLKEADHG